MTLYLESLVVSVCLVFGGLLYCNLCLNNLMPVNRSANRSVNRPVFSDLSLDSNLVLFDLYLYNLTAVNRSVNRLVFSVSLDSNLVLFDLAIRGVQFAVLLIALLSINRVLVGLFVVKNNALLVIRAHRFRRRVFLRCLSLIRLRLVNPALKGQLVPRLPATLVLCHRVLVFHCHRPLQSLDSLALEGLFRVRLLNTLALSALLLVLPFSSHVPHECQTIVIIIAMYIHLLFVTLLQTGQRL